MPFRTISPTTGHELHQFATVDVTEADQMLQSLEQGFVAWRRRSFEERAQCLRRLSEKLLEKPEQLAELMALEMGKPLKEGIGEIRKCAGVCAYFADKAEHFLKPDHIPTEAAQSYVAFQPLGPILAIMPWNFPFWQVFRFVAPALMAGNTVMLKHAPNVTSCALVMTKLMHDAGIPENVVKLLKADLDLVQLMISRRAIRAVTLTGSTRAGRSVAETAGRHLKKVVLELGGSDPYLILEDADIEAAAKQCVTSRLINGGQSCIAAKRLIVCDAVADDFIEAVRTLMAAKTFGDPIDEQPDIGPMARQDLRDELHRQVYISVEMGAKLLLGGKVPDRYGWYYPPSLIVDAPPHSPAYHEELFGPVASIFRVKDEAEAIHRANTSSYGLGAAVFTGDPERGERIAGELEAGAVFVNDFVRSDQRLPFGGIKDSGYGRELSIFGIREFVNVKTVWVSK